VNNDLRILTDAELDTVTGASAMSTSVPVAHASGSVHTNTAELPPDPVLTAAATAAKAAGGALWALLF
jgi:hypothetical protein